MCLSMSFCTCRTRRRTTRSWAWRGTACGTAVASLERRATARPRRTDASARGGHPALFYQTSAKDNTPSLMHMTPHNESDAKTFLHRMPHGRSDIRVAEPQTVASCRVMANRMERRFRERLSGGGGRRRLRPTLGGGAWSDGNDLQGADWATLPDSAGVDKARNSITLMRLVLS